MSEAPPPPSDLNIWHYKPWWCQPWSILLTGIGLIAGSWFILKTLWITIGVALPVLVWMSFFLLVYPQQMQQYLAESRQNE